MNSHLFASVDKLGRASRQGIFLGGSAVRIIDRLGLGSDARILGSPVHAVEVTDVRSQPLLSFSLLDVAGSELWAVPKDSLLQLLYEALPAGCVRFGHTLHTANISTDHVRLDLARQGHGGQSQGLVRQRCDFVVGADSCMSPVKKVIATRAAMLMNSGYAVYSAVVRHTNLADVPLHVAREIWHAKQGIRFGYVRVTSDHVLWWTVIDHNTNHHHSQTSSTTDTNVVLRPFLPFLTRRLHDFPPVAHALLAAVESERTVERSVFKNSYPKQAPWVDAVSGRVALVGDARRLPTPHMFHLNHSLAIDDAYILANLLLERSTLGDDTVLAKYDENREANLSIIRDLSKHAQSLANSGSFPRRYVDKALLMQAINRMVLHNTSSILQKPSVNS